MARRILLHGFRLADLRCSSCTQSSPKIQGYDVVLGGLNPHSHLSKARLLASKLLPWVHAQVLGGLVVQPFGLLTHSKLFLPLSKMFPSAHSNITVGSGHPLALSWKLRHSEGNSVKSGS